MLYNYPKMPGNGSGAVMKAGAAKVFVFIANVIVTVVYWNLQALLGRVLLICWQNAQNGVARGVAVFAKAIGKGFKHNRMAINRAVFGSAVRFKAYAAPNGAVFCKRRVN